MDRLLARLRDALRGARRAEAPGGIEPSGAPIDRDLAIAFREALAQASGRLVAVADDDAARRFVDASWPGARVVDALDDPDEEAVREADVGVDRADLLIAETGTVVRTYPSRRAARVALVPMVSVFLARPADLVRDLPSALERVAARHREGRTATVLITGPSRTADIEKQLVIPAHGPRELVVLLVTG